MIERFSPYPFFIGQAQQDGFFEEGLITDVKWQYDEELGFAINYGLVQPTIPLGASEIRVDFIDTDEATCGHWNWQSSDGRRSWTPTGHTVSAYRIGTWAVVREGITYYYFYDTAGFEVNPQGNGQAQVSLKWRVQNPLGLFLSLYRYKNADGSHFFDWEYLHRLIAKYFVSPLDEPVIYVNDSAAPFATHELSPPLGGVAPMRARHWEDYNGGFGNNLIETTHTSVALTSQIEVQYHVSSSAYSDWWLGENHYIAYDLEALIEGDGYVMRHAEAESTDYGVRLRSNISTRLTAMRTGYYHWQFSVPQDEDEVTPTPRYMDAGIESPFYAWQGASAEFRRYGYLYMTMECTYLQTRGLSSTVQTTFYADDAEIVITQGGGVYPELLIRHSQPQTSRILCTNTAEIGVDDGARRVMIDLPQVPETHISDLLVYTNCQLYDFGVLSITAHNCDVTQGAHSITVTNIQEGAYIDVRNTGGTAFYFTPHRYLLFDGVDADVVIRTLNDTGVPDRYLHWFKNSIYETTCGYEKASATVAMDEVTSYLPLGLPESSTGERYVSNSLSWSYGLAKVPGFRMYFLRTGKSYVIASIRALVQTEDVLDEVIGYRVTDYPADWQIDDYGLAYHQRAFALTVNGRLGLEIMAVHNAGEDDYRVYMLDDLHRYFIAEQTIYPVLAPTQPRDADGNLLGMLGVVVTGLLEDYIVTATYPVIEPVVFGNDEHQYSYYYEADGLFARNFLPLYFISRYDYSQHALYAKWQVDDIFSPMPDCEFLTPVRFYGRVVGTAHIADGQPWDECKIKIGNYLYVSNELGDWIDRLHLAEQGYEYVDIHAQNTIMQVRARGFTRLAVLAELLARLRMRHNKAEVDMPEGFDYVLH